MNRHRSWSITKIALFLALLVGGFTVYQTSALSPSQLGAQVGAAEETAPLEESVTVDQELIAVIEKVESLQLDGAIFQDPSFLSLQDNTVTLTPQTPGRTNPFAPLGSTAPAPKTTTPAARR